MGKHVGIIHFDDRVLLKFLGFEGGQIKFIGRAEDYDTNIVTIVHPDMPECADGDRITTVVPAYKVTGKYQRVSPPVGLRTKLRKLGGKFR